MASLPRSGDLESHPLPRLLMALRRERFGGALTLSREDASKRILFQEGAPVFAESSLASESLGVQLLDAGAITREDHARVSQSVQERGCKEGTALLELGILPPREIFRALKSQVRQRILACFAWPGGRFELEPGETLPDGLQPLRSDPLVLVQEGLERHWPAERLLAQLATRLDAYPVPGRGFASVRRRLEDEGARQLLDALDGDTSLGALLQQATTPRALTAAWLLDAAGALEYRDAPASRDKLAEAAAELEVEIATDTGAPRTRARTAAPRKAAPDAGPRKRTSAAALEALRREVLERHAGLGELDHYAVLGVRRGCDLAAVKTAYFRAAKRFHPDALASVGLADLRPQATVLFARVARAYATLTNTESRGDYDAELDGSVRADADRLASAESLYRKGEILLRAGDFAGALRFLRPAAELWPEDATYQSGVGWALFKKTPPDAGAARTYLERAVALDARNATAFFRLGAVLRTLGETQSADDCQKRARKLDPKVTGR